MTCGPIIAVMDQIGTQNVVSLMDQNSGQFEEIVNRNFCLSFAMILEHVR